MKHNRVGDVVMHPSLGDDEKYLVVETVMTGGGTGHGPHDVFPDGHRITLIQCSAGGDISISPGAHIKRFYQSGCFSDEHMIEYLMPVAHMPLILTDE